MIVTRRESRSPFWAFLLRQNRILSHPDGRTGASPAMPTEVLALTSTVLIPTGAFVPLGPATPLVSVRLHFKRLYMPCVGVTCLVDSQESDKQHVIAV